MEKQVKKLKNKGGRLLASWLIKIFILTFSLSLAFSSLSEVVLSASGIAVAVFIILFFLIVQYVTDIIAIAVTACDEGCFSSMAAKKVKGAREAVFLVSNKDKVASFLCDIVGDVCGILSGTAGAAIVLKIVKDGSSLTILVAALIAATIASVTVTGKAAGKAYAKKNSEKITFACGKALAMFTKKRKKNKEN